MVLAGALAAQSWAELADNERVGPFRWARKLYDPTRLEGNPPEAIRGSHLVRKIEGPAQFVMFQEETMSHD